MRLHLTFTPCGKDYIATSFKLESNSYLAGRFVYKKCLQFFVRITIYSHFVDIVDIDDLYWNFVGFSRKVWISNGIVPSSYFDIPWNNVAFLVIFSLCLPTSLHHLFFTKKCLQFFVRITIYSHFLDIVDIDDLYWNFVGFSRKVWISNGIVPSSYFDIHGIM